MPHRLHRLARGFFLALLFAVADAGAAGAAERCISTDCIGDCDGDRRVTISEIVLAINILLASGGVASCASADASADGKITIDELVLTVRFALEGCPQTLRMALDTSAANWMFSDVTGAAGIEHVHEYAGSLVFPGEASMFSGGVAAGDYDGDGLIDLFLVGGFLSRDRLFRNRGDGTFVDVTASAGLTIEGEHGTGPLFADYDGDGHLDLFIGGIETTPLRVFRNRGNGTFEETTAASGLSGQHYVFSAAMGDPDLDGDLDLFLARWAKVEQGEKSTQSYFRNTGGLFEGFTIEAGLQGLTGGLPSGTQQLLFNFTPNFTDLNNDGWPDLLVASDWRTSRVFLNDTSGRFVNVTDGVISDENGMGGAVGDYDGDGDMDWFVTGIFDPNGFAEANWHITGNRLYRNKGDGRFEDVTDIAGVRHGFWGWAACFADFNNDSLLDIFHVNGFGRLDDYEDEILFERAVEYLEDPSRLFVAAGDGTFTEEAEQRGVADRDQGRGVVCFDYDYDGDIDILVANNGQPARLYRNDGGNARNFLSVTLRGRAGNRQAIGARIAVRITDRVLVRELRAGSNYASQDPPIAHFGLGEAVRIHELRVLWPDGSSDVYATVPVNSFLVIDWETRTCRASARAWRGERNVAAEGSNS